MENNQDMIGQMLSRLLAAEYDRMQFPVQLEGSFEGNPATGRSYGGQVTYNNPDFNVALRGYGYRAKTPYGEFTGKEITGGGLEFPIQNGLFGIEYDKSRDVGGAAVKDLLNFYLRKQF